MMHHHPMLSKLTTTIEHNEKQFCAFKMVWISLSEQWSTSGIIPLRLQCTQDLAEPDGDDDDDDNLMMIMMVVMMMMMMVMMI